MVKRNHNIIFTAQAGLCCGHTVACRQHAVIRSRRTAALQITQHRAARFYARCFFNSVRHLLANTAKADRLEAALNHTRYRHLAALRLRALSSNDDAKAFAGSLTRFYLFDYRVQLIGNLRQQDNIRAACNAAVQRNPACIASHNLQHHNAVMRFRRRMQPVESLRRHRHRRVKAEGTLRAWQVVVDRLGHAHNLHAALTRQLRTDIQAAVAADDHQRLDIILLQILQHLLAHILIHKLAIFLHSKLEGVIAVRRA